jgi:3-dehydroshikimate dehydratase
MLKTGLVSVTFRKLSVERVIELSKEAGIDGIEWGGDIHVPHGETDTAVKVRKLSEEAGLKVAAYGSYYKLGTYENPEGEFEKVLESAKALGAPLIRVWAGNKASKDADYEWWDKVVTESRMIAQKAHKYGIKIAYEYHANTLTDTKESTEALLTEVNHENIYTYWQPNLNLSEPEKLDGLRAVLSKLTNVHIFYWEGRNKRPLIEGVDKWRAYIEILQKEQKERYVMIEFVKDDSEEQFLEDAAALKKVVQSCEN